MTCRICSRPIPPQQGPGRPAAFCSVPCRRKAKRLRNALRRQDENIRERALEYQRLYHRTLSEVLERTGCIERLSCGHIFDAQGLPPRGIRRCLECRDALEVGHVG